MDRAKVIAPRRPEEHSMENVRHKQGSEILKTNGAIRVCFTYICMPLTCKHHHVLEIGLDLVASSEIQKKRKRVNVGSSAQEHRHLGGNQVKEKRGNWSRYEVELMHCDFKSIPVCLLMVNHKTVGRAEITRGSDTKAEVKTDACVRHRFSYEKDTKAPTMNMGLKT